MDRFKINEVYWHNTDKTSEEVVFHSMFDDNSAVVIQYNNDGFSMAFASIENLSETALRQNTIGFKDKNSSAEEIKKQTHIHFFA
ncbi:MAG: hypothetical protein AB7U24_06785 [Sulfurimonadaceae bacterium]